jgi:hypothetical protein
MRKRRTPQLVIGILVIVTLFAAFIAFRNYVQDPDQFVADDTAGWIVALERQDGETRVAAFRANGDPVNAPNSAKENFEDRDPAWSATGNHVFFSSNRESNGFNIMRWRPVGGEMEERVGGTRSLTSPFFPPTLSLADDLSGLLIGGGQVMEFEPKSRKTYQLLPPSAQFAGEGGEGGSMDPMVVYERYGTSFRQAMATPDRALIYTIMRSDLGDALVLNFMVPPPGAEQIPPPLGLVAGDRITMDMAADGTLVVGVEGFRFPDPENIPEEAIVDGRPQVPYRNAVMLYRIENGVPSPEIVAAGPDDINGFFIDPAISPDGQQIAAALVRRTSPEAALEYTGIIAFPAKQAGASEGRQLSAGESTQPDWSGDGSLICYVKRAGGERQIYVVPSQGGTEKRISQLGRDYSRPQFSPQVPKE